MYKVTECFNYYVVLLPTSRHEISQTLTKQYIKELNRITWCLLILLSNNCSLCNSSGLIYLFI